MSFVPTFVKADDGRWYQNPEIGDKGARRNLFYIVFDDDEPIELVIDKETELLPEQVLQQLGVAGEVLGKRHYMQRIFDGDFVFRDAACYWIEITQPIPSRNIVSFDSIFFKKPDREGVYYDFGG